MNKDLQKENIDRAARRLLEATRLPADELEKIVAAPHLFDSVKARIKTERTPRRKAFFFAWNLQTATSAFAVLLVLLSIAAVIFSKMQSAPQTAQMIEPKEFATALKPPEFTPPAPLIAETTKAPVTIQKTNFKRETPKTPARAPKTNPEKTEQVSRKEPKAVFYPLAYGGNWEAAGEDLRVVRAELSRSELFALGVNLPVENESARIKTDLLVGADGVARAIRFVE